MGTHIVVDFGFDFDGRKAAAELTKKLNRGAEIEYRDLVSFSLNNPSPDLKNGLIVIEVKFYFVNNELPSWVKKFKIIRTKSNRKIF